MPIRILIVDDHRLLRAGLKTLLNSDPNFIVVGEAVNGEDALQVAQETAPDVVLMDISMSGMDGLEATRQFKKMLPDVKILIMAMHEDSAPIKTLNTNEEAEPLSARETEILRLIVKGYSNRQIGDALNISVRTVETHRSNVMDKLNLHSRLELVHYATEHGLV